FSCCFSAPRRHPTSTLFPYTTLFRSQHAVRGISQRRIAANVGADVVALDHIAGRHRGAQLDAVRAVSRDDITRRRCYATNRVGRSEEHTSELQSPCNLVCRLLLEKQK